MQTIEQALDKLEKSKFRSSFHLTKKEKEYIANLTIGTVLTVAFCASLNELLPQESSQCNFANHIEISYVIIANSLANNRLFERTFTLWTSVSGIGSSMKTVRRIPAVEIRFI